MRPTQLPEYRARVLRRFEYFADQRARGHDRREVLRDLVARADASPAVGIRESTEVANARALLADNGTPFDVATLRFQEATVGPDRVRGHWNTAELFHVSAEMAAVAAAAAQTMPRFELQPSDLPAVSGLLHFSDELRSEDGGSGRAYDVVTVWGPLWGDGGGVELTVYAGQEAAAGDGIDAEDALLIYQMRLPFGDDVAVEDATPAVRIAGVDSARDDWARIVRCCWLLMQQRIAAVSEVRPDRASSRRLARAGRPTDPVRVITLRSRESGVTSGSSREYVHRWVRRGHWRRQWYPSQGRHVPIWIHVAICGPDGAPLLGGEKVYAWTR